MNIVLILGLGITLLLCLLAPASPALLDSRPRNVDPSAAATHASAWLGVDKSSP